MKQGYRTIRIYSDPGAEESTDVDLTSSPGPQFNIYQVTLIVY